MNNLKILVITVVALLGTPLAVVALDEHAHDAHDHAKTVETNHHGEMKHDDHGQAYDRHDEKAGMTANGSMIIVGSSVNRNVKGTAHLKDVSTTMAKMGMPATHHFMIAFVNETSGEPIENGTVALKITDPDAKVGEAIELIGMDGHFGADVVLDMQGEYHFKLGTQLTDGVKRKYHFHQVIE